MRTPFPLIVRRGTTYLEVQVAMVLLALSTAGLYSVSVVQTRQTARLHDRVWGEFADQDAAINPSTNRWARKLGVLATVEENVGSSIPIEPDEFFSAITNDGDAANTSSTIGNGGSFNWIPFSIDGAFGGDATFYLQFINGFDGGHFDSFVRDVPPGNYEVLITHPTMFGNLGTSVLYQVFDGNNLVASRLINQRVAPAETEHAGAQWKVIDTVPITSGTVRIRINDGPNGVSLIVADAVAIRSRKLELLSLENPPSGGALATVEVRSE